MIDEALNFEENATSIRIRFCKKNFIVVASCFFHTPENFTEVNGIFHSRKPLHYQYNGQEHIMKPLL